MPSCTCMQEHPSGAWSNPPWCTHSLLHTPFVQPLFCHFWSQACCQSYLLTRNPVVADINSSQVKRGNQKPLQHQVQLQCGASAASVHPPLGQPKAASKGTQKSTEPAPTRIKQEVQDSEPEIDQLMGSLKGSSTDGPHAVCQQAGDQVQLFVYGWQCLRATQSGLT